MHNSSWRPAPTSCIASFCRAPPRRFAAHLCTDVVGPPCHDRCRLQWPLSCHGGQIAGCSILTTLHSHWSEYVLRQASPPTSHHGGLTTGQKWAIALGAVLFGMAVKVCARCSPRRDPLDYMRGPTQISLHARGSATMSIATVALTYHLLARSAMRMLVCEATLSQEEASRSARGGHHGRTPRLGAGDRRDHVHPPPHAIRPCSLQAKRRSKDAAAV